MKFKIECPVCGKSRKYSTRDAVKFRDSEGEVGYEWDCESCGGVVIVSTLRSYIMASSRKAKIYEKDLQKISRADRRRAKFERDQKAEERYSKKWRPGGAEVLEREVKRGS